MLRENIFEILNDLTSFNEAEIKDRIWELFEEEGFDINEDGLQDKINLLDFVDENSSESIMLSAARIIYKLDLEGWDIIGSGLLEDDSEWERFESRLENE